MTSNAYNALIGNNNKHYYSVLTKANSNNIIEVFLPGTLEGGCNQDKIQLFLYSQIYAAVCSDKLVISFQDLGIIHAFLNIVA